ncbi:hypothetical protein OO013_15495 [Mangrovivirga sp. M17]|uniref:Outer membrane protein beta-barrel domain-containing protein n=1 Tax=Mangrovivirga halotolerans TaxID=2993936 RepID=A0ABT3RVL4_9BACT|nr:hypothetical protein [Mangrovivirga halotolerans]MCX2745282.1 hypothetical protein [Mangrovivirga halotolerans]
MKTISKFILILLFQIPFESKSQIDLQPDFVNFQYAGNFGFISFGGGYDLLKPEKPTHLNLGFYFGYLPEKIGGIEEYSLNTKLTYIPDVRIDINDKVDLNFFSVGLFINYAFGDNYFNRWSSHYPDGYYWWTPSVRFGVFVGGGLNIKKGNSDKDFISLYYDFSTHDLELVSYVQNTDYLSPLSIFNLSLGAIIYLR